MKNKRFMTIIYRKAAEHWWGKDSVPDDVHHFWHDVGTYWPGCKPTWQVVTWKDIFKKRKDKQEVNIWRKRNSEKTEIKPGFVWVFHVDWFLFGGYWLYIKTHKKDYGISFSRDGEYNEELILKVMELFPCGVFPVIENFGQWAENFAKTYPHKGFKRKKNQGLKKCFCKIQHGDLKDVFIK